MNYPVWNLPLLGGSLTVAIIAVIHVLISHLAIGGGAFLAIAEIWSDKVGGGEKIREWLHKFATFFLVFTTVFGAITGVGIWFSIQLASPEGTSLLIHQYVFAWATEWVMFIGELSVLYLYYYGWKTNSRARQRFLAIMYFVIAWGSLFVINGILTFMLTPGGWTLENTDIAAGFFNPGFWPSLVIRSFAMFLFAGLAAIMIATRIDGDDELKNRIINFAAKWVIPSAIIIPAFVIWYWSTLPEGALKIFDAGQVGVAGGKLEAMHRFFWLAVVAGALIVISTLFIALRPRAVNFGAGLALFLTALLAVAGAEFFREMARKPYVISGVLYSNNLWKHKADEPGYLQRPYFDATRWEPEGVAGTSRHGEWVYRLQCASCHSLNGYRAMSSRTKAWTPTFGPRFLEKLDEQGVMPKFHGDLEDRAALTAYFLSLHSKEPVTAQDVLEALKKEEEEKRRKKEKLEAQAAQAVRPVDEAQPASAPALPATALTPVQAAPAHEEVTR